MGSWIGRNRERILVSGIVIIVLYLVYLANYAFFHTTVEGIVVVIASAIFLLAWKSRQVIKNNYFLFLGIAFLFFAIITFLHALTAPGVGIFLNGGGPLSSQFWIAGQFMLAVSLLVAPFFIRKNLWFKEAIAVFALIDLAIIASILFWNLFPVTYVNNAGSTLFKNASEYVISIIMVGAMVILYRNRSSFDRQVLSSLLAAFALTIVTELTLTFMASSTDIFSFAGHIFRLFSFYFFYVAIIETGLQRPYDILYRELRESEEQMRIALEAADLGTWSFDLATGIAEHSLRHDQIFGYSEPVPEWSYEISIRHMLPEFHAVARDAPQQAIKTGKVSFEAQVRWPDGSIHWINPYGRVRYDKDGNPVCLAGVVADITERKNAETAIRESEERFRKIAESLPVLISLTRLEDSTILFTNTAYNDAFGFRKGELVGRSGPDVYYDPADRVKMIGILSEQDSVSNYKIKAKKSNGLPILLLSSVNTILYDGKPAIIGASIDITEREQAEEALKESDLRLRLALEAGKLGWHDYRPLTGEITWDPNCRAMWGLGPDDPVNIDAFWAGIHPDSVGETQRKLAAAIDPAGDGHFDGEYLVRPLDGSPSRWIHATGLTIFKGTGAGRHPGHVIGTVQDITERKKAEEALRESEERLRLAQEA
ncbi:MAG TPA: MASE3 domain-containing protein, partial [Methanoregula sp.]|nr:MASE3 domain-containing protein [Methanoregula sp.]